MPTTNKQINGQIKYQKLCQNILVECQKVCDLRCQAICQDRMIICQNCFFKNVKSNSTEDFPPVICFHHVAGHLFPRPGKPRSNPPNPVSRGRTWCSGSPWGFGSSDIPGPSRGRLDLGRGMQRREKDRMVPQ